LRQYIANGEKMKRIYNIVLLTSILTLAVFASASTVKMASALGHPGPYYSVGPSETIMGPSPAVGQTFTVTVKLYNATTAKVPAGVGGIEIHLTWNNTLIEPVSFVNKIGLTDGVLTGPGILYGLSPGFYDIADHAINAPPYTNATHYKVAAASTSGPWWGNGTVVEITFRVRLQPQPFATCPLALDFTDLADANANVVPHELENATYKILTTTTTSETVTFQGVNYTVSIASDSIITAPPNLGFQNYTNDGASITFNATGLDGFCNVTIPKNLMWDIWTVTIDGSNLASPNVTTTSDTTKTYVWFNFTSGPHVVTVSSTKAIPEFAATSLILFLMATTLIVTGVAKSLRRREFHR